MSAAQPQLFTTRWAHSDAVFSDDRRYRYWLERLFVPDAGRLLNWLMLNGSMADAVRSDNTVATCERLTRLWGYDGYIVTNIFGWMATDPRKMLAAEDPIGPLNDRYILQAAERCEMTICGWGNHGRHLGRSTAVRQLLASTPLYCLGTNESTGEPIHPLAASVWARKRLGGELRPVRWI